jgi:2-oxo-4-hydroxy-4-carboxy-5-ureidoimidazoline decarboxylase
VLDAAERVWAGLERADYLEAFRAHPEIGANLELLRAKFASTAGWSSQEQASIAAASDDVLEALRAQNVRYSQRFGYIFIVCATGKSAQEMLDLLTARLDHSAESELAIAAAEQAKITALRLGKLAP